MNRVSFVIPSYNGFHLVNQLLVDIRDNCTPDEIIVVDDFSTDQKAVDGLAWWAENYNVTVLRTPENLGFLRTSNLGMKQATGDIVCLISTDVRVEDDLARIVKDLLTVNPKQLIGGRLLDYDTGWNTFDGVIHFYLEGWFLATGKQEWQELGYFDERYSPNDMEDVDVSTTAAKMGWTLSELPIPTMVSHIGAQSIPYGKERENGTITNKERYRIKWHS